MTRTNTCNVLLALCGLSLLVGCAEEDHHKQVAEVATQAADRQAQQNTEMVRLNREVAEGTRRMVEADAEARKEIIAVHQEIQSERASLNDSFETLEAERKQIAGQRRTESMLGPILKGCAAAAVIAVTIGYCWSLLFSLRRQDDAGQVLSELLVDELLSEKPVLLPPRSAKAIEHTALPEESQGPPRLPPVG